MSRDVGRQLARSQDMSTKGSILFQKRAKIAQEQFTDQLKSAYEENDVGKLVTNPAAARRSGPTGTSMPWTPRSGRSCSGTRCAQRGNEFVEHAGEGLPPVLHFDYETVVDGRKLARPVNYALVRIIPPEGVTSIRSGVRTSSSIRVRATVPESAASRTIRRSVSRCATGHPVYFVIFFRDPEPGQTLLDVCEAEKQFVHKVRELHPRQREAGDRRQLPGRLGGDDACRRRSRRHGPDRDQRRADVVLGRRVAGRRGRQPDALRGRHARRHVARLRSRRTGRRRFRRRVPRRELRESQSREHVLGQVLPPVREHRHRAAALSRVRALVGRLLPDESRGDRVDHAQSVRRQQAVDAATRRRRRRGVRSARHQGADHPVRVDGRQHHAAAAGVQLGRRRLRFDRRDQGARPGDRRTGARRTSATSASSCPARWRRRSMRRSSRC